MRQQLLKLGLLALLALTMTSPAFAAAPVASSASPAAPAPSATVAASDIAIMPHRAVYRMELASARNHSNVRAADGLMVYEWKDACNGWQAEQRLNVDFTHEEAESVSLASTYLAWESKDGKSYRFNYRRLGNGQEVESFRGSATLSASGGEGKATYVFPEPKEVTLPPGSYFPTAHTLALLQAAASGKPMFTASVFDGTDATGLSEISAVIGHRRAVQIAVARTGSEGKPDIAWPVRMAFFSSEGDQAEPDYEMDTTILPNGVSEFMLIDYGDFKLRGTLEKLELLPKPDC